MSGTVRVYIREANGEIHSDHTYFYEHSTVEVIERETTNAFGTSTMVIEFDPPLEVPAADE